MQVTLVDTPDDLSFVRYPWIPAALPGAWLVAGWVLGMFLPGALDPAGSANTWVRLRTGIDPADFQRLMALPFDWGVWLGPFFTLLVPAAGLAIFTLATRKIRLRISARDRTISREKFWFVSVPAESVVHSFQDIRVIDFRCEPAPRMRDDRRDRYEIRIRFEDRDEITVCSSTCESYTLELATRLARMTNKPLG